MSCLQKGFYSSPFLFHTHCFGSKQLILFCQWQDGKCCLSIFNWGLSKVGSIYKWVGQIRHRRVDGLTARPLDILAEFYLLDVFLKTPFAVMDSRGFKVIWWRPKKFANDWPLMVFNLTFQKVRKFNNLILSIWNICACVGRFDWNNGCCEIHSYIFLNIWRKDEDTSHFWRYRELSKVRFCNGLKTAFHLQLRLEITLNTLFNFESQSCGYLWPWLFISNIYQTNRRITW